MTQLLRTPQHADDGIHSRRQARRRAALVVCDGDSALPKFLLVSARRNPAKLTLPGGKVGADESPRQAAIRETREEAGVLTDAPIALGQYVHSRRNGRQHPTLTFLARYAGERADREPRTLHWLTLDELLAVQSQVRKPIRKQIEHAAEVLMCQYAA